MSKQITLEELEEKVRFMWVFFYTSRDNLDHVYDLGCASNNIHDVERAKHEAWDSGYGATDIQFIPKFDALLQFALIYRARKVIIKCFNYTGVVCFRHEFVTYEVTFKDNGSLDKIECVPSVM